MAAVNLKEMGEMLVLLKDLQRRGICAHEKGHTKLGCSRKPCSGLLGDKYHVC